jgi:hypothetical protein
MNTITEQAWEAFHTPLHQFIRRRVADEATAEDLLQEVFLKIQPRESSLQLLGEFHRGDQSPSVFRTALRPWWQVFASVHADADVRRRLPSLSLCLRVSWALSVNREIDVFSEYLLERFLPMMSTLFC